jgi:hypothetical protein
MKLDVLELYKEVSTYLDDLNVWEDGERIYTNYQKVTGYAIRLTELRNEISLAEITGEATPELKKFRTMVLDPTIERFDRVAQFESRKITGIQIEMNLERKDI